MKANELRIGNLISLNGIAKAVIALDIENICVDSFAGLPYSFDPIPITEEWLKMFGFEDWGINHLGEGQFVLHNVIDGTSDFTINVFNGKYFPTIDGTDAVCWYDFIYIHQLQNLYFALTGQELVKTDK